MDFCYGENLKISIFGQSHAPAVGVTIEGLPAGVEIDTEELQRFLDRRAPGRNQYSTSRKEADAPEFLSGVLPSGTDGKLVACGTPVTAIIKNTNIRPQDYEELKYIPRPGHADYTANIKYGGSQDVSGGGAFSGRMTAPLCIAGGICIQLLAAKGIEINAKIRSIAGIEGDEAAMFAAIDAAKAEGDSVGGVVECVVTGLPAGIGGPMFGGLESRIAQAVFGIPAVKGVEFGAGFAAAALKGSENNDPFAIENGKVVTKTNNCGGILGGISTGMPLVFRAAFKPTPSIALEQDSVDLRRMQPAKLSVKGRHDPCIVPRAVPVVEAAAAIAIYDAMM